MGRSLRTVALAVAILMALVVTARAQGMGWAPESKASRWESNLSVGRVSTGRLGAAKTFYWYAVPKVIALGLSFDWISESIPFSLAVALNAPIPIVIPFACAGAGAGLDGCGINYFGGGLKVRLGRRFGLVAEYRNYRYTTSTLYPPRKGKGQADFFGAGFAWIY